MRITEDELLGELLAWYVAAGADESIGETPVDRLAAPAAPPATAAPRQPPPPAGAAPDGPAARASAAAAIAAAREAARAAGTLDELKAAVAAFDGCALKLRARNTVFADGDPASGLMLIGEAPGVEEDRLGLPFVGASGQLLDRMLASIGRDRTTSYITNVLFWQPPGNRKPTEDEVAICRPFVERHIALVAPRLLVIVGGTASAALHAGSEGITRLRGRWLRLNVNGLAEPVQAIAMYHPSFLLRSPERKREAWLDLLSIKSKLASSAK